MMQSKWTSALRGGLISAGCALALALPASAADTPPASSQAAPSTAKSKRNVMSRDELRTCLADQDRLQQVGEHLKGEQEELDRRKAEVERIDAEIERRKAEVERIEAELAKQQAAKEQAVKEQAPKEQAAKDQSTPEQMAKEQAAKEQAAKLQRATDPAWAAAAAALKQEEAKRSALVDAYNARLPALREQGTSYQTGRDAWLQRCGNRDYDEMDEAAIRLEQKRAAAAANKKK